MPGCSRRISNGSKLPCAGCTGWRWAARPWERASTRPPALPKRRRPRSPSSPASPLSRPPTSSPCRVPTTRWSNCRGRCAPSQFRSTKPGSSIMPGKVNPTQCEALTMLAVQVMANDVAVGFGGAGGYLEMNVYKPLMIFNITHSITLMTDGCINFHRFLVEGTKPNLKKISEYVERSLMLVTALSPVIGYDKASKIAHYAMDNDLTLKAAALKLGFVTEAEFDRVVDPKKMVKPYVATGASPKAAS